MMKAIILALLASPINWVILTFHLTHNCGRCPLVVEIDCTDIVDRDRNGRPAQFVNECRLQILIVEPNEHQCVEFW